MKLSVTLLLGLSLLLASCSAGAAPENPGTEDSWQIGVLYWSMNIPGQVAMRRGLESAVQEYNASGLGRPISLDAHVAGDGEQGIENQIRQMERLIASRPDLIIVQPTDNAALAGELVRANEAGIPVVAYDQYISGPGHLACFLTSHNYQAGALCGEYIADRFADNRELKIVMVEYPHVSSTVERVNGFLDALNIQHQPYHILQTFQAVEPVAGRRAGREILEQHPEPGSIDVVFTVNDGGGLPVVEELAAAGRSEILIATVDGDSASVENIRAERLTVIDSAQFCWHLGYCALLAGREILEGRTDLPPVLLVPTFPITSETLNLYKGWYGSIPEPFSKPWASQKPIWKWELVSPDGEIVLLRGSP